jgi:hypothetical protein
VLARAGSNLKIAGPLIFTSSYVARMPHTLIPAYSSAKACERSLMERLTVNKIGKNIKRTTNDFLQMQDQHVECGREENLRLSVLFLS